MWIIFGNRVTTERVPGGLRVERRCDHCGETAVFYERRATTKFQVYFLDVFEYGARRVMACGACGTLYATDELGAGADGEARATPALGAGESVVGALKNVAQQAGAAITAGAARARDQLGALRRELASDEPTRADDGAASPDGDPLADEDAALLARFEALERKARERSGGGGSSDPR